MLCRLSPLVFTSSLLFFQTFVAAKPLHRIHDSPHHNGDLPRTYLPDPADSLALEALKIHESRSTLKDAATTFLSLSNDVSKRQETDKAPTRWVNWRSWGPYAATRNGNYVNDAATDTKPNQLLSDFDSSFEALIDHLAEDDALQPQHSGGCGTSTELLGTQPDTPNSPSNSQRPDVIFDPFPSIQPIAQSSAPPPISISPISLSSPTSNPTYNFNPIHPDLTAVYYAQSPGTGSVPLSLLCSDPNINTIILAFVSHFFTFPLGTPSLYPTLNLASKCWAPNSAQTSAGATGLVDCVGDGFAGQVAECQRQEKKVLLSLGGAQGYSDTVISSDEKAVELAETLWGLFLGCGSENQTLKAIRPFGDVVLDGIDIDNENPDGSPHLPALATHLRALFSSHRSSKPYYLSAAPQCPRPDLSIPIPSMLNTLDFIWPQFYNNPSCNLNSGQPFLDSVRAWSNDLSQVRGFVDVGNGISGGPRLLVCAPADAAAGSGYVDVRNYTQILQSVKGLGLGNLGGGMFWDGAYVELSKGVGDGGFAGAVKEVLGHRA